MQADEKLSTRLNSWAVPAWVIAGFLIVGFMAYGSSLWNDFVRFDDGLLIYENPAVRQFSFASLKSIFTTYDPELYIPLTLFLYQMLYLVFGINAFGYHLAGLLLQVANALILSWVTFALLRAQFSENTKEKIIAGVSIATGLFFLLHPLNTESVAWAAALKDQLSTLFYLLSLLAYLQYRSSLEEKPYRWSLAFFLLGLLSKVTVLTLPLVFFFIEDVQGRSIFGARQLWKRILPYVGLSTVFLVIALFGKREIVANQSLLDVVLLSCKSVLTYFEKLLWPTGLSVNYPQLTPITLSSLEFQIAAAFTVLLFVAPFALRKFSRWYTFGIGIFFLTVFPSFTNLVKGTIFVFASDRYAYLPSLALFIAAATGAVWLLRKFDSKNVEYIAVTIMIIIAGALGYLSHEQAKVWANTEALNLHTIALYPEFPYPYNNLANAYRRKDKNELAVEQFQKALTLGENARIQSNLAATYANLGRYEESLAMYQRALVTDPTNQLPDFGLGVLYAKMGNIDKALESYGSAIAKDPEYIAAHLNRGSLFADLGRFEEAEADYKKAIQIQPHFSQAYFSLGIIYQKQGMLDEAILAFENAIQAEPRSTETYLSLGVLQAKMGKLPEAKRTFEKVLQLEPGNPSALSAIEQIDAVLR